MLSRPPPGSSADADPAAGVDADADADSAAGSAADAAGGTSSGVGDAGMPAAPGGVCRC